MKKTGIELITEERKEQIEKHCFSENHDEQHFTGELIQAAMYCLDPTEEVEGIFPQWHNRADFINKIDEKTVIEQLTVAGALIAAEIDRLQANS